MNDVASIETATTTLTAFDSFAELCAACETGYVPTIPLRKNGAAQQQAWVLVRALSDLGYGTWQPESGR